MAEKINIIRISGILGAFNPYTRSIPIIAATTQSVDGEAITSWDLDRFMKSPALMWNHNDPSGGLLGSLPIGRCKNVSFEPGVGLKMEAFFSREDVNPLAAMVANGVRDDDIRAVSVGYISLGGGKAQLLEVSFCGIGADEDAGTPALNPEAEQEDESQYSDEQMRAEIRKAAATLGRHRARTRRLAATRTDASDGAEVERMDRSPIRLDAMQDTPSGGKKIKARLSRTGVLVYRNKDGSTRGELRTAEENFRGDAMATLDGAPVIDVAHHTEMVTSDTWKKAALGHTSSVEREADKFISATLHINDRATLDAIERGDRTEISAGYRCRLREEPGVFEGVPYQYVQTDLRFNHVALCPPNRGRAGNDVGLRFDGIDAEPWAVAHFDNEENEAMAEPVKTITKIRLDDRDYEEGSREHIQALEAHFKTKIEVARTDAKIEASREVVELQKRLDSVSGERDGLKGEVEKIRLDLAASKKKSEEDKKKDEEDEAAANEKTHKAVKRFVGLYRKFERLFGKPKDKDEEEKMDAMDERELSAFIIKKHDPHFDMIDADTKKERSTDYLTARLDAIKVDDAEASERIGAVVGIVKNETKRLDAKADDDLSKSALKMIEAQKAQTEALKKRAFG